MAKVLKVFEKAKPAQQPIFLSLVDNIEGTIDLRLVDSEGLSVKGGPALMQFRLHHDKLSFYRYTSVSTEYCERDGKSRLLENEVY